jgi:hypothetical protein
VKLEGKIRESQLIENQNRKNDTLRNERNIEEQMRRRMEQEKIEEEIRNK